MSMQAPNSRTFFDLLVENAARYPIALAAVDARESITYEELAARARRVASRLRQEGISRGDVVGLLLDNRITWIEIFFGVGEDKQLYDPGSGNLCLWGMAKQQCCLMSPVKNMNTKI